MRLLSIGYPWNITIPEPKAHWLANTYHVLLTWIHSGVHPHFQWAASSLYHRCVRNNLRCRNASNEMITNSPLKARLYFLCFVRTRPLIKFTEYHSQELNALESGLQSEIYVSIDQIKEVKRCMLHLNSKTELTQAMEGYNQAAVFKLLAMLAQVAFRKA